MNTTIYLIRHGRVDNPNATLYGRTAVKLTFDGRQQLLSLAKKLKGLGASPEVIFSSPMQRTIESTEQLSSIFPEAKVEYRDDLQETDCGKLLGKPMSYVHSLGDFYFAKECESMGIEKPADIIARMHNVIKEALEKYQGKTVFVVSHGDPLAFLFWQLTHPGEEVTSDISKEIHIVKTNYLHKGEAWKVTLNEEGKVLEYSLIQRD